MAAMIGPFIILISTSLLGGTGADAAVIKAAHNTTVELTCIDRNDEGYHPVWYMNGPAGGYTSNRAGNTAGELIGTLIINGNRASGTFSAYCRPHSGSIKHNTILTIEGRLPSPENIHINETNTSLFIDWSPPYSATNDESSIVNVDPHVTQYTVYIVDNYTGNYADKVNVTETSFRRNISDDHSCPVYRVTAWNSGGEGSMSAPLPGYLPRVPNSIAVEDVDIHREPGALDIHLHVNEPCTVRIPNTFLVTVMSTDGVIISTVQEPVTTIHIALPQNVDDCNLIVRISSGNSAGMSSPTQISVGCETTSPSTSPSTDTTTTTTGSDATPTDFVDQMPQGDYIIYIAIGIPVGAVVIVATGALLLIIRWKCKRKTNVEPPATCTNKSFSDITEKSHEEYDYTESPSLGGPPVHQPDSPPATTSYARPQAPEGNPLPRYVQIDPAKHRRPQPPADNNRMQYAQREYQDQL